MKIHLVFLENFCIITLMMKIISPFLLIIISIFCLYPCLDNDFVNWDDNEYILQNLDIRAFSIKNLNRIFSTFYAGAYVPLTIISYALDYQIAGLNPKFFHIVNLILHLINILLVFWVIYLLCNKFWVSFLTALIFAIHPLHIEPVAWATGRKDLLYALFFMGAVISYIYYKKNAKNIFYYLTLFLFILALFSKPVAITLPFVLMAIEYFVFNQLNKNTFKKFIPLFVLSLIFFIIAVIGQKSAGAFPQFKLNLLQQINISFSNFLFYLYKLFFPVKLACIYPVQNYWFAPILILIIIISTIISLKYTKLIALSMTIFFIMMLPVLQLFPVGQILSDRYTYLSITGFLYLISAILYNFCLRSKHLISYLVIVIICIIISILFLLSNRQCRVWKDSMTLWNYVINTYPDLPLAYNNRGILHTNNKNYQLALKDFDRAIFLNPMYLNAYVNRGNIYGTLGENERALNDYNKALQIDSTNIDAYHNRAVLYFNNKKYKSALSDLLEIIKLGGKVPDEVLNYVKMLAEKE